MDASDHENTKIIYCQLNIVYFYLFFFVMIINGPMGSLR